MCCAGCNTVSTAEQAVLCILSVVRNYPTAHKQIVNGKWNLAEASSTAYDLEGKHVGYAPQSAAQDVVNCTRKMHSGRVSAPPRLIQAALCVTWTASTSRAPAQNQGLFAAVSWSLSTLVCEHVAMQTVHLQLPRYDAVWQDPSNYRGEELPVARPAGW